MRRNPVTPIGRNLGADNSILPAIRATLIFIAGITLGLLGGWFLFHRNHADPAAMATSQADAMTEMELQRLVQIARSMRPEDLARLFGLEQKPTTKDETTGESMSTVLGLGVLSAVEAGKMDEARQLLVARISRFYNLNSPGITGKTVSDETARLLKRIEDTSELVPTLKARLEEERRERATAGTPRSEGLSSGSERLVGLPGAGTN